jgi:hypothetical protein
MSNNLKIELKPHLDGNNKTYYVGKLEFPGTIDCSEGVSFLVFISEPGCEEIQVANINKKDDKKDSKEPQRVSYAHTAGKTQQFTAPNPTVYKSKNSYLDPDPDITKKK